MQPKPAATVLILRPNANPAATEDYEILLMERHSKSPFMGGAYVFPGGKVEDSDQDLAVKLKKESRDSPIADGYRVAASRECFEEAGVLLTEEKPKDWQAWRQEVQSDARTFAARILAEKIPLNLESIFLWAHWITPSFEGRRYDTKFFITEVAPEEQASIDLIEATKSTWLSPSAAAQANQAGDILLMPPTVHLLDELRQYPLRAEVFEAARTRAVAPILPRINKIGERMAIILPWDPLYPTSEGESLEFDKTNPFTQTASRIVLHESIWKAEFPG